MGRRSRKRTAVGASARAEDDLPTAPRAADPRVQRPAPPAPAPAAPRLRARLDEAPKAPWHPFPLVELSVLAGMVLIVIGILSDGDRRPALLFGGLALVSVAALELAIREHFAGYRSHSTLLAAVTAIGAAALLFAVSATRVVGKLPQEALLGVGLVVGALAFRLLRSEFSRRARGLTFRA
jgi:hypothetical protein